MLLELILSSINIISVTRFILTDMIESSQVLIIANNSIPFKITRSDITEMIRSSQALIIESNSITFKITRSVFTELIKSSQAKSITWIGQFHPIVHTWKKHVKES